MPTKTGLPKAILRRLSLFVSAAYVQSRPLVAIMLKTSTIVLETTKIGPVRRPRTS
jgi:hypothetical protein